MLPLDMFSVTELLPGLYEKAHQIVWWAFVRLCCTFSGMYPIHRIIGESKHPIFVTSRGAYLPYEINLLVFGSTFTSR
jgi:hypothetical protein